MIRVIQIIICFKIALNSQYFDFINKMFHGLKNG